MEDPAFNALLIASEYAPRPDRRGTGRGRPRPAERAERLTATLTERLWDAEAGLFRCRDLRGGDTLVPERSVSGLIPLLLPALPGDIVAALVRTLGGPHFSLGDRTRLVPSYDPLGEAFDPHRYWRGPAWFNTSWLLERGCARTARGERADALREAVLDLADATGFAEARRPVRRRCLRRDRLQLDGGPRARPASPAARTARASRAGQEPIKRRTPHGHRTVRQEDRGGDRG